MAAALSLEMPILVLERGTTQMDSGVIRQTGDL